MSLDTEAPGAEVLPFAALFQRMQLVRVGEEEKLKIAPPPLAEFPWNEQLMTEGEEKSLEIAPPSAPGEEFPWNEQFAMEGEEEELKIHYKVSN